MVLKVKCILPGKQTEMEEQQSNCLPFTVSEDLKQKLTITLFLALSTEHVVPIDSQTLLITFATFSSALFTPNTVLSTQHPQA